MYPRPLIVITITALILVVACTGSVLRAQTESNFALVQPQTIGADAQNLRLTAAIGGPVGTVAFVGNRAYVGEGYRLTILDWSDPSAPVVLGQSALLPGQIWAVAIVDTYAYVANDIGGLRIFNIANPLMPRQVGHYDAARIRQVTVANGIAYVGQRFSDGGGTLQLVNVQNPATPVKIGEYKSPDDIGRTEVVGSYAYFNDTTALRILDISNPANPTEVGSYPVANGLADFAVTPKHVYLAANLDGLRILEYVDDVTLNEIGSHNTRFIASGVHIDGNYAYMTDSSNSVRLVDISDPSDPGPLNSLSFPGTPRQLSQIGDTLYVVDNLSQIHRVKLKLPESWGIEGTYATPAFANAIYVSGFSGEDEYAYVADGFYGLRVVKLAANASPTTVGTFQTSDDALAVAKNLGDYVYVATYSRGLRVIDVSDPAAPTEAAFYDTPGNATGLQIFGGDAYVADGRGGLRIIDIRTPTNPTEVGFFDPYGSLGGASALDLATRSNRTYAFLADDNLRIVDVTNRASPQEVQTFFTAGNVIAVDVFGDYAYLLESDHLLRVIDISNLNAPTQVATLRYQLSGAITFSDRIQVIGNLAYLTDGGTTLRVLDITNPTNPTEVGYYDFTQNIRGLWVTGSTVYVGGGSAGLFKLHYPDCYRLTTTHTGQGIDPDLTPGNSPGCPTGEFVPQAFVTLGAAAAPNWQINGWSGTDNDGSTLATNTLTMPAADFTALVRYSTTCHPLTLTRNGGGSVPVATPANSPTCALGQYVEGEAISVHAAPAAGWRVASWAGVADTTTQSTDNTLTMPGSAQTVGVSYEQIPATVTGDAFEDDDSCATAQALNADGLSQEHTLHVADDEDWVRFNAVVAQRYRIEVQVPSNSPADVDLEVYGVCAGAQVGGLAPSFAPGVKLDVTAAATGPLYLRLVGATGTVGGADHRYAVSVRALAEERSTQVNQALILVGGSYTNPDRLQANINHVTDTIYDYYRAGGLAGSDIIYLTNDPAVADRTGGATLEAMQSTITNWAQDRLSIGGGLTLYLMDHGDPDKFYLDNAQNQVLTPQQLDSWLDQLEDAVPDLKITIIIEACYSGSFIEGEQSISKDEPGRLVITSTSEQLLAYASSEGAYFSDFISAGLEQGYSLHNSFRAGYAAVRELSAMQQEPWIDANGNGIPNEPADITLATQQVSSADSSADQWAPYIVSAAGPTTIENRRGVIQAEVRDDKAVRRVWAVIKPPSYQGPNDSSELVPETLPTIVLSAQGGDSYAAEYAGFDELGTYQIAIYAEDEENLVTLPKLLSVSTGSRILLPLVVR